MSVGWSLRSRLTTSVFSNTSLISGRVFSSTSSLTARKPAFSYNFENLDTPLLISVLRTLPFDILSSKYRQIHWTVIVLVEKTKLYSVDRSSVFYCHVTSNGIKFIFFVLIMTNVVFAICFFFYLKVIHKVDSTIQWNKSRITELETCGRN